MSYFLDAAAGTLGTSPCGRAGVACYDAGAPRGEDRARFSTQPFDRETELTGPVKLKLWLACEVGDADLMVRLIHLDQSGQEIAYPAAVPPAVGAAYGWLRVSHRKLDPERSTPERPYLAHDEIQKTAPDEIVSVEVELWPTSIVLEPGQRLELEIAARDDPRLSPFTHTDERDRIQAGRVTIHSGPEHDSHLLLPRIPPRP